MATPLIADRHPRSLALNPDFNVWVSASAGTGKTKILTDRILRLLLEDEEPHKILCLTFTKAAAAEMKERLLHYTLDWATCSEEILKARLTEFLGNLPSREQQEKARSVFKSLTDVTPGVRITTIHSFCQSLLSQFPVEAGIIPSFKILTDHESQLLLKRSIEEVLMSSSESSSLKASVTLLTERFHLSNFKEVIEDLIGRPERLQKIISSQEEDSYYGLESIFKCHRTETPEDYLKQFQEDQRSRHVNLQYAGACLLEGGKTDNARGYMIQKWLSMETVPSFSAFQEYANHFLTGEGTVRKTLASTAINQEFPTVLEVLLEEAHLIWESVQKYKNLCNMKMTKALYDVGSAVLEDYSHQKISCHSLDYNDLIYKTKFLLTNPELAPWVLYKLDGGISHILIDEAQDTNDIQWEIIQALTEEFYAGESAQSLRRSLFAVGDPKQSIYSFQGTSPAIFEKKKAFYHQKIQESQQHFHTLFLETSFRSTPVILEAVNAFCAHEEVQEAINPIHNEASHISHHEDKGGVVELWPLIESENKEISGREHLAHCLAQKIKTWLHQKVYLEVQERPIEPSDILILLRERGSLMSSLIAALKAQGISVAGPDRLLLLNEIVIQDLIAVGEFLLLPDDDLNLACVLKSPLIGLTEEDLFTLAYNRKDETLWYRLQENSDYRSHATFLSALRNKVDYVGPFSLYADLLNHLGGRKKFHARLGEECLDALEEFLNLCLDYERTHTPSLQDFLRWLKTTDIEVKRDFSKANSGVRVMTVHGAKGLQAPVVILADTTTKPVWRDKFLWQENPDPLLLWSSSEEELPHHLKKIKEALQTEQYNEYWRLLYVAMTRAEERLYITGVKSRASASGSWYDMLSKVLAPLSQKIDLAEEFLKGEGLQLYKKSARDSEDPFKTISETKENYSLPRYFQECPSQKEISEPLISSLIEENFLNKRETEEERQKEIFQKLLNHLPFCSPEAYENEAQKILKRYFSILPRVLVEKSYQTILRLLNHPNLQFLWTSEARIQVPFVHNHQGKTEAGILDRVIISDKSIDGVVYKIGDERSQDISKREVSLYYEVLQALFPGKNVKVYFLWIETAILIEMSPEKNKNIIL